MDENKMLIDATHPEEIRVVVLRNGNVEEFDYESAARKLLRGSIFLAKITRVEPSLQAAFVDYGVNRHGFLAFNEIHPDYYQIPHSDRQALIEEEMSNRFDEDDDLYAEETIATLTDADQPETNVEVHNCVQVKDDEVSADDLADPAIEANAIDVSDLLPTEPADEATNVIVVESEIVAPSRQEDPPLDDNTLQQAETTSNEARPKRTRRTKSSKTTPKNTIEKQQSASSISDAKGADASQHEEEGNDEDDSNSTKPHTISAVTSPDERIVSEVIEMPADDADSYSKPAKDNIETTTVASYDEADFTDNYATPKDHSHPTKSKCTSLETIPSPEHVTPFTGQEQNTEILTKSTENQAIDSLPADKSASRDDSAKFSESRSLDEESGEEEEVIDEVGNETDALGEVPERRRRRARSYKIQEVIKRRQVVLVQVVKEERGNKGAALTTYLSLAGRYTVLMPNTARGGGISRKITNLQDRKRLKTIAQELDVPEGMGLIIRTAGAARTKQEIKRDFEYLLRLWENVRDLTLQSTAPSLVYEEGNLIKRSIRDLYSKDIDKILVAGEEAHKEAKSFMRMLMPSHAKNVVKYEDKIPLFARYRIESQLNAMFSPFVQLKSGGYLVINQTEALVAVDVNSGKSTKKFSIEETALNTNLEAAEELARQLKLRDLAGLIVVDFIDMEEKRNNRTVERRLKECLRNDRARIQVGRISHFGLLEMSRQRLRTGVLEGSTMPCQNCQGTGSIRSTESIALALLRSIEDNLMGHGPRSISVFCSCDVAIYLLNHKRHFVLNMEANYDVTIHINTSDSYQGSDFAIERMNDRGNILSHGVERSAVNVDIGFADRDEEVEKSREQARGDDGERRNRRRRRRRSKRSDNDIATDENSETTHETASYQKDNEDNLSENRGRRDSDIDGEEQRSNRRRRGRRGGRRSRGEQSSAGDVAAPGAPQPDFKSTNTSPKLDAEAVSSQQPPTPEKHLHVGDGSEMLEITNSASTNATLEKLPTTADTQIELTDTASAESSLSTSKPASKSELTPNNRIDITINDLDSSQSADDGTKVDSDNPRLEPVEIESTTTAKSNRSLRGEPVATPPVLERVVMTPEAENMENIPKQPARKGWWQRRFGGS